MENYWLLGYVVNLTMKSQPLFRLAAFELFPLVEYSNNKNKEQIWKDEIWRRRKKYEKIQYDIWYIL